MEQQNNPIPGEQAPLDKNPKRAEITKGQLDKRIESIHDTVKQARSALFLCILASGAMFLCLWNTYASWDRDFAFPDNEDYRGVHKFGNDRTKSEKDNPIIFNDDKEGDQQIEKALKEQRVTRAQTAEAWENHIHSRPPNLHEHQMHSWIDTQVVSVALLGIKISVSDFAILGSGALSLCSLYLLLCVRRENHEIGYLFREMSPRELTRYGAHALAMISSYMVFNVSGLHSSKDSVICSLDKSKERGKPTIRLMRKASRLLDYFPAITILMTILCDVGWTFWPSSLGHMFFQSPFRAPGKLAFAGFSLGEKIYFGIAEALAVTAAVILFRISYTIWQYDLGTRDLLEDISNQLIAEGVIEPRWPDLPVEDKEKKDKVTAAASGAST